MKNLTDINHTQLYDLFKELSHTQENLILRGNMSDELTMPIIDYNLAETKKSKVNPKRLSFFIAESFQNIVRHGQSHDGRTDSTFKPGTYGITRSNNSITLHSSNLISEEDAGRLDDQLKGLSLLSAEELKELYLNVLTENEMNAKGGAGLGLIEMVRKSKGAIKHQIEKTARENLFHFEVSLTKNEHSSEEQNNLNSIRIHELMKDNNITFLVKTHFSHEKFIQLNEILNKKIIDTNIVGAINSHKMNYFFVELIQNIYKHSKADSAQQKEGIFILKTTPHGTQFCTGNYISSDKIGKLKATLDLLNHASQEDLDRLYQSTLLKNINFDSDFSGGIGLLEIKRMTPHKFEYYFTEKDSDAFFVNSITLGS